MKLQKDCLGLRSRLRKQLWSHRGQTYGRILWQGADVIRPDDTLQFTDNGYDLIVHAMDLHWAN
jgi:hypothetical protein